MNKIVQIKKQFRSKAFAGIALLLLLQLCAFTPTFAQPCTEGAVYGVQRGGSGDGPYMTRYLHRIDPVSGASMGQVADLFGGGAASNTPSINTANYRRSHGIALDPTTNKIWFASSTTGTSVPPRIYSYDLNAGTTGGWGTTSNLFQGIGTSNLNHNLIRSGYNPANGKIYFSNNNNRFWAFDPNAIPLADAVNLGIFTSPAMPSGQSGNGDLVFDALGNMIVLTSLNGTTYFAVFPAQYDGSGNYTHPSGTGTVFKTVQTGGCALPPDANGIAFDMNGNLIVGSDESPYTALVNTTTGIVSCLNGSPKILTADLASCPGPVAFQPDLKVTKEGTMNCDNPSTVTWTIKVKNPGIFHAFDAVLKDTLPAGLTLTGATLNGVAIPAGTLANLGTTGIYIKSPHDESGRAVLKGDSAIIVITTEITSGNVFSNQAFVSYAGIPEQGLPDDQVPSDNPYTSASDDITLIGCFTISGTVYNDADGMINGVDGTEMENITVILYAADGITPIDTTTTDANGDYIFDKLPPGDYVVKVTPPTANYEHVSSTDDTPTNGATNVTLTNSNVTGVDFGIEEPPVPNDRSQSINYPEGGIIPAGWVSTDVAGTDPEQGALNGGNASIIIDTLPANATMYYDGVLVNAGDTIHNFDPALLSFTGISNGATSVVFDYSFIDAASVKSKDPGSYTINWVTPLPVTLLYFNTSKAPNGVLLNWATASEQNNSVFIIERSTNARYWEQIGFVSTQAEGGNSNMVLEYDFTDESPAKGTNYYRLKQVDCDGGYAYSPVRVIYFDDKTNSTNIYPNPVKDQVTVSGLQGNESVHIYNTTGSKVRDIKATTSLITIDLDDLAGGVYHIRITAVDGTVTEHKMVKTQ